ncbi:unnamed protein product [Rodentolepis nana]|uniref:Annexin n=1 Tax=Rodentolepis nana TaxID=102285 RepID=A0A158QHX1_RODNA|nr:unnamed protein product [Rodentolepis nana]
MPLAGGIPAPTITPLRLCVSGKASNNIDTGTFIELGNENPNCNTYFTTNGETPNPSHRIFGGKEVTFRYRAPFQLKAGRRTVKAIAVHKVNRSESHVVSKTFNVTELTHSGSSGSVSGDDYPTSIVPIHNDAASSMDDSLDSFMRKNTDQGFAATNHSGTQINVYGSVPGVGWDMKTPDGNNFSSNFLPPLHSQQVYAPLMQQEPGVTQHQLTAVVNHLNQYIDQMRQRTVIEVRESLSQAVAHILKSIPKPQLIPQPAPTPAVEYPTYLKGPLGQIMQQFNSYATISSNILNELCGSDVGKGNRDESPTFDRNKAKRDAEEILAAGEKKLGTDESKFNEILISRSNAHLRAVFQEYEKISKKTIEEALKSEMSGDLLRAFLSVVRSVQNKPAFFAKTLHRSMKGLGTDDESLIRVVVSRCEIDMVQIKEAFKAEYKQTLGEFIKNDTSGDYRLTLLTLIGDESLVKK